jgi:hypothetical protein
MKAAARAALDNRSRQLNPRDVRFAQSHGIPVPDVTCGANPGAPTPSAPAEKNAAQGPKTDSK